MPLTFTAIDFETANAQRGSACAVGVARVTNGVISYRASTLIRPLTGDDFSLRNTGIHGLRWEDCETAPDWAAVAGWLDTVIGDDPVIAHNAPFEKGVIAAAHKLAMLDAPVPDLLCTVVLAKAHLALDSYRLPTVAAHLGVVLDDHHDAEADAVASAEVALALGRRLGRHDVHHLWSDSRVPKTSARAAYTRLADFPAPAADADPTGPLFGETVVFTGEIDGMPRKKAQALVAAHGASIGSNVTRKTTLVVMGTFGPGELKPGEIVSAKVLKARELALAGQRIEILDAPRFGELLAVIGASV
ncbi:hypothetical protein ASF48_13915 [Rathayibacter sp. Leaf299]|uniref:exonuclease domain-containing protein n=1 Tax=unclassified Rathayibacter TaxID=2609250 RepID=UPI0006F530AF|nr:MULTISPECIES: exonuclease domain-containing protein [unclassified Rathayibacter]KQQ19987.1 hypothetical protein ASF48_13915 [Rathayibacter sp. Leaf299]